MFARKITLALVMAASLGTAAGAQEAPPLKMAESSRLVYDAGVATKDPLLVLAAAKLRKSLALQASNRAPEDGEAADGAPLDFAAMLDTARDLAAGDDLMLGLIEDAATEGTKGVVNGPVYNIANLRAKGTDSYNGVPFEGGKYAEIYVEASGSQDMNLHVYDAQNRLVCSDTDASAIAYCGWRPRSTGGFSIKVTNASGSSARYSMMTN
ncbi:hypothetical protein [Mesobacterium pallidum]|uniref:hypothetical protein n=1 Tax=Mesobacterium pallidum TaxID=2872037 RepID=UPI001EE37E37|nr:hypothetical protein [Mesobacterium pallidum]